MSRHHSNSSSNNSHNSGGSGNDISGARSNSYHSHDSTSSNPMLKNSSNGGRFRLATKSHPFAGAVLSPKHAQELTPSLCLAIASALAQQQQQQQHLSQQQQQQQQQISLPQQLQQPNRRGGVSNGAVVPYTLWITEAWRVLGWAEPSAALFWEMATMYQALIMAGRAYTAEYNAGGYNNNSLIPPILSCGSASSVGSGTNNSTSDRYGALPKPKYSSAASAKELPVWLVGTFLLLHCEEYAYQRNLSGQDERRFGSSNGGANNDSASSSGGGSKMDFTSLFKNSSLSPRTRLHAGWNNDNTHCTAYLLRHLRKILLLCGVSNNPEAIRACIHLAAIPAPQSSTTGTGTSSSSLASSNDRYNNAGSSATKNASANAIATGGRSHSNVVGGRTVLKYSSNDLRRQHDDEHGNVGVNVRLTMDDLDHLDFLFQLPSGGGIDDPPLRIADVLWNNLYNTSPPPPTATIALSDVEREIRQHLEMELIMVGFENDEKEDLSSDDEDSSTHDLHRGMDSPLSSKHKHHPSSPSNKERAKQPNNHYNKELSYTNLRGTTILLRPNPPENISSGVSVAGSVDQSYGPPGAPGGGRLHDLVISDCSDAHFYLLQPFEHATIASCTNCTIVVGAVAGLLHVVDCEKTNITSASRRIVISNSCDTQLSVFSPCPPLMVGDNRMCQIAPYNTYYDGLHEDLLATGLATINPSPFPPPETQSPYARTNSSSNLGESDGQWPQLQKATNKWKQPIELSKLEVPQVPGSPAASAVPGGGIGNSQGGVSSPGADDKAMTKTGSGNDAVIHAPVLVPPSEFNVLFVPLESEASRQRRLEAEEAAAAGSASGETTSGGITTPSSGSGALGAGGESQYCRLLAEVLQLSPFRLPLDYERRVLMKAERMRNIQTAVQKKLNVEQQRRFEEELNRGFRDWLVTSGNLRQVLDLVHLERRGGI